MYYEMHGNPNAFGPGEYVATISKIPRVVYLQGKN